MLNEKVASCQSKLKRAEEKLKTLSQLEIECEVRIKWMRLEMNAMETVFELSFCLCHLKELLNLFRQKQRAFMKKWEIEGVDGNMRSVWASGTDRQAVRFVNIQPLAEENNLFLKLLFFKNSLQYIFLTNFHCRECS